MTMIGRLEDGQPQYDIVVRTQNESTSVYRTNTVLSDRGGASLLGRGTRVWAARKVEHGQELGEVVALKDCWVDGHREREGSLNLRIRASGVTQAASSCDELDGALVKVSTFGDVYVAGMQDCTRLIPHGTKPQPRLISSSLTGPKQAELLVQVHTRIIYSDVGRPLTHVASLSFFFASLAKAVEGESRNQLSSTG